MNKTFTLIEMLIVIVIIGILAADLIPRLQSIQWRARDSKRKVDIGQLRNIVKIYELDYGKYPIAKNGLWDCSQSPYGTTHFSCNVTSASGSSRILGLTWYATSLPIDPININNFPDTGWLSSAGARTTGNYIYGYMSSWYRMFTLLTQLENRTDPDICATKGYIVYGNHNGSQALCASWPYSNANHAASRARYMFVVNSDQ